MGETAIHVILQSSNPSFQNLFNSFSLFLCFAYLLWCSIFTYNILM